MRYLFITVLAIFSGCDMFNPKYQVGDCFLIIRNVTPEFILDPSAYNKILKVGKINYLFESGLTKVQVEFSIDGVDRVSDKIDCSAFDSARGVR